MYECIINTKKLSILFYPVVIFVDYDNRELPDNVDLSTLLPLPHASTG